MNNFQARKPLTANLAEGSSVKKLIGVVSGKGGVGKSLVTSLLATHTARLGKKTAILDADVTGPSIPHSFGKHEVTGSRNKLMQAVKSNRFGIKMISTNLLLETETTPVLWKGPIVGQAIRQFWSEVDWGEIDTMYVDMPPGTGDVALTVFQSLPVDGIVIVTTPQEMVGMIVEKALNMAKAMNVPVLGLIENMSYYLCPDCDKKHYIFGEGKSQEICERFGIPFLCSLAIDPEITKQVDQGKVEDIVVDTLTEAAEKLSE